MIKYLNIYFKYILLGGTIFIGEQVPKSVNMSVWS